MNAIVKPDVLAEPAPETLVDDLVSEPERHASSATLKADLEAARQELSEVNEGFANLALSLAEQRPGAQEEFATLRTKRADLAERVEVLEAAWHRAERHERYASAHREYAEVKKQAQKNGGYLSRRDEMLRDFSKHIALAGKAYKEAIRCVEAAPKFGSRVNSDALLAASQIKSAAALEMYRTCGQHDPLGSSLLALPGAEVPGLGTRNPDKIPTLAERAAEDSRYVKAQWDAKLKEIAATLKEIEAPEPEPDHSEPVGIEPLATS